MKHRKTDTQFLGHTIFMALTLVVCGGFILLPGCDSSDSSSNTMDDNEERFQEEYFKYAVENLQRIEQFGGGEMRQQIVDKLNQWIAIQKLPESWEVDPMLKSLSLEMDLEELGGARFSVADGYALQQAIWMRELSKWTCGDSNDPVERGAMLFDWIVRNIQLQKAPADGLGKIPKQAWETLFFGRGTAVDRAWVFALAARQQAIDAVVLMVPSKDDPEKLIPWAIGVLKDKELYLFEPELGLPIPAKDGVSLEGLRLVVKPATLSQVLDDPTILEQLDVSEASRYPITAEQVKNVVAMIPSSEASLSARFALVESRMMGSQRAILTIRPSALAKELREVKGLAEDHVRLWPRPFVVEEIRAALSPREDAIFAKAMQPFLVGPGTPLWKGRAAHIIGKLTGERGATYYYQRSRPSNRELIENEEVYANNDMTSNSKGAAMVRAFYRAKDDATYWLGLVNYSLDDLTAAVDYFLNRTLKKSVNGPWHPGAIYNLGRCLEEAGQLQEAANVYRANKTLANTYGNQLRAEWLDPQRRPVAETPTLETPPTVEPEPEAEPKAETPEVQAK